MVTRRNAGIADCHAGNGDEASETTPEEDNPVTTLAKGRTEEEISEEDTGEFHPFSTEIAETPFPSDFREPPLKDYDGTTDPQAYKSGKEPTQTFHQPTRTKKGYDSRGRNFQPKANWDDRRRTDQVGGYGFDTFTPLNASRARILKEVYQSDLIRLPPQVERPKGPYMSKWCDYHRAKGHDTEDCWTLMNKIERLIKEGYLGRYVKKRKDRGDRGQRRDEGGSGSKRRREDKHKEAKDKEEVRGVVTTIAGGFSEGEETSLARRRYTRQVMTIHTYLFEQGNNHPMIAFTNEDFRGIQSHQDDPMVIDVLMAKYRNSTLGKISWKEGLSRQKNWRKCK
ncbi:hypothetical protein SESBI_07227 [Sesbania bispinosa]|nr:hypothetical protein SESBI_07227 [Sesbania bispinosa]